MNAQNEPPIVGPPESPGRAERAAQAAVEFRRVDGKEIVVLPLRLWRQRYNALMAAERAAWDELFSYYTLSTRPCSHCTPDGPCPRGEWYHKVYTMPRPGTEEYDASRRVDRDKVEPAVQALREFFATTGYHSADRDDDDTTAPRRRAGRRRTIRERQAEFGEVREALIGAVRDHPGAPKAAVLRIVATATGQHWRPVAQVFEALRRDGTIRFDAPTVPGGAGRCWLTAHVAEA